jgi:hypothetical protein
MKPSHLLMRRVSGLRPGVDRAPVTLLRTKFPPRLESSIRVPAPEGLSYLPFQRAGIEFLSQCEAALLADEMGLDKSIRIAARIRPVYITHELNRVTEPLLRTQQIDYLIVQDLGEMVGSCARSLAMIGESAFRVNNSRANGRDVPGGARYGNFFYEFRS